jgi:hypothetical protein
VKILNPVDITSLQWNAVEIVSASHDATISWLPWERNMEFRFENILLPDSNTNEPLSHGFVRYKIKTWPTLVTGDTIPNQAFIYFDFNSPIATNTAKTAIVLPTGMNETATSSYSVFLYPNPAGASLDIHIKSVPGKKLSMEILNVYGQKIRTIYDDTVTGSLYKTISIDDLAPGIYFIRCFGAFNDVSRFLKY